MRKHIGFHHSSLAAFLFAGMLPACKYDPLAGTSLPEGDAGNADGGATIGTGASVAPTGGAMGGAGGAPSSSAPTPVTMTDSEVLLSAQGDVDILFMIDNSPSMDPKQKALADNFPKMIQTLQQLPGGMPNLHIGVISSDMGAGSVGAGGANCQRTLGDKGLLWGNDPNNLTASVAPNSLYGTADPTDPFRPVITDGCGLNLGARWIVDVANPNGVGRTRNYTGNLADVFSCLAKAVYVNGCGYEHQLQSVRLALNPQSNVNVENVGFVRPSAFLSIVLVTDEDDCSADPADTDPPNTNGLGRNNDGMFSERNPGDTGSLKCAARGHVCNGQPIPDYDPQVGYTGQGFSTNFANCAAKDDKNPRNPIYLPLIGVQDMIASVNSVPGYVIGADGQFHKDALGNYLTVTKPSNKIFVSGIIGWPANDDPSSVQYQIGKDATAFGGQDKLWDYMPVCTVPAMRSADGNIYKAYGGLRLKKFIDAFGQNGQHFSICNSDFTGALTQIGNTIANSATVPVRPACIELPLVDSDPNLPGLQPECTVTEQVLCDAGVAGCPASGYAETIIPECKDSQGIPLDPSNPQLDAVSRASQPCWYMSYDSSALGCAGAPNGQKVSVLFATGNVAPMNTSLQLACLTCSGSCTAATPGNVGIVTFSSSAAVGAMTGQGWVALGAIDVITDPTCGGVPITNAAPCVGTTTWNTPDSLCVSGSIPELPSAPGQADYTNNWGIQIGVNASQTPGVTIGKTFSTINLGLTGLPTAGLRVELHRAGDPDGTTYCHEYTGQPIKLTDFRTMCWGDITSVPLTASDVANIDRVDIQASSTVVPITVTNMCLNSITFGP